MGKKKSSWGSMREKRPGYWEIRYSVVGDDGRSRQISETVKGTKRIADERLMELRIKYDRGTFRSKQTPTLTMREYWGEKYYPEIQRTLSPQTVIGYTSKYRTHIEPRWGDVLLRDIRYEDLQSWILEKSPGNSRGILAVMRAILSKATATGYMLSNPSRNRFKMPEEPFDAENPSGLAQYDIYSPEELDIIFRMLRGQFFEATWIISAFGGANRCEAVGVWREEIAFQSDREGRTRAIVPVLRDVTNYGSRIFIGKTKRPSRNRHLVIPSPYADRLRYLVENSTVYNNSPWLLHNIDGSVYNPSDLSRAWEKWVYNQHGGIRWVPWKNLRPSYATALLNGGVEIDEVAKILGHTTPNVTYSNYDRRRVEDSALLIGKAFSNDGTASTHGSESAVTTESELLKSLINTIPKEQLMTMLVENLPQEKMAQLLVSAL